MRAPFAVLERTAKRKVEWQTILLMALMYLATFAENRNNRDEVYRKFEDVGAILRNQNIEVHICGFSAGSVVNGCFYIATPHEQRRNLSTLSRRYAQRMALTMAKQRWRRR